MSFKNKISTNTNFVELILKSIRRFFNAQNSELGFRFLILGGLIGILSGFFGLAFHKAIELTTKFTFDIGMEQPFWEEISGINPLRVLGMMAFFGAFVAWFTRRFAPEAQGHGVPEIIKAVATDRGVIRGRVSIIKLIASTFSIGAGFSVGREGPTALIGASLGSFFGQKLNLSRKRMKMIVGCGAASGIAATFNAPLAGTAFALELIVGNLSLDYISPIIVSSMVATVIAHSLRGDEHVLFSELEFAINGWQEIMLYALLGLLLGLVGVLFTRFLYKVEDVSEKIKLPVAIKGALGGLLMGGMILYSPFVAGPANWDAIRYIVSSHHSIGLLSFVLILSLLKVVSTSVTLGAGGSGGIFAPTLLIGCSFGTAFGIFSKNIFPNYTDHVSGFGLVGMGALIAAVTQAPLTAITIVFELTNDYSIILPLFVSCTVSMATFNHMMEGSIYTLKLIRRGINLHWGRDKGVLQSILVQDILRPEKQAVLPTTSLVDIIDTFDASGRSSLPVVDGKGILIGVLSYSSVSDYIRTNKTKQGLTAANFLNEDVKMVTPGQNLYDAFLYVAGGDFQHLPVVDNMESRKLIGKINRSHLLQAYQNELTLRGIVDPAPR